MQETSNIESIDIVTLPEQTCDKKREDLEELKEIERTIGIGLTTFLAIGYSLTLIREKRLYRHEYKTFDEYLWKRWKLKRSHGYRLIQASEFENRFSQMSPQGDIRLPNEERGIRAILKFENDKQLEVLCKANELAGSAPVLSKHVQAAIKELGFAASSKLNRTTVRERTPRVQDLLTSLRSAIISGNKAEALLQYVEKIEQALLRRS